MKREFEFSDGNSNKFWNIELSGTEYTVNFGKKGTNGQTRSKEFDSEELATKEFEKQISSKLKKGYEEIGEVSENAAPAQPAAKKKTTAKKAVAKKKKAATESDEEPTFSSKIIRSIDLDPVEKSIATWEKPCVLEKPKPKAFNRESCIERFRKANPKDSYYPHWGKARVPKFPCKEEARFWLSALQIMAEKDSLPKQIKKLESVDVTTELDADKALNSFIGYYGAVEFLFPCLAEAIPHEDLMMFTPSGSGYYNVDIATGFRKNILPYATLEEREELKKKLAGNLAPVVQQGYYSYRPASHIVAAQLGMHDEIRTLLANYTDGQFKQQTYESEIQWLVFGLASPDEVESEFRRLGLKIMDAEQAVALLATAGNSGLDILFDSVAFIDAKADAEKMGKILHKVHSPEAAEIALRFLVETKAQKVGLEWLLAHPVATAVSLSELATGKGKLADAAKDHLLMLNAGPNRQAIEAAFPNLSDKTVAWVKSEIIDNEDANLKTVSVDAQPEELKNQFNEIKANRKLPDWIAPQMLPPIRIGDGKLDAPEVEKLLSDIKVRGITGESELSKSLKKHAEPTSLDAFAWKVFESWQNIGSPPKDKWAMGAIGHLGGDSSVLKLTPLVREWPGQSQHARAVLGLDCLRKVGTETALMALNGIAQKLKYKGLKEKAQIRIREIADERGLTSDQLADRIVPDCGLDEKGGRTFDFGPRKFEFVFTSEFKPAVRDEAGKVRVNLPKPNQKDDPNLSEISLEEWKLLKKTLREALKIQNARMEEAMITGRRWEPEDFKTYLIAHPLLVHLVRSIIWGAYDKSGNLLQTFRITEDNSVSDSEDEDSPFPTEGTIGVVHPAHLTETDKSNWGEVLSDYELIPPFQQLGRSIYGAEKGELDKQEITRFKGPKIPGISLYGILERTHWLKDTPADGGGFMQHSKYFPSANITAFIQYDPGLSIGWYDEEQQVTSVYFVKGHVKPDWWGKHDNTVKIGKIDTVVLSEVLRIVHVLVSKAT